MQIRKNLIQNPSFEYDVVAANPPTNWTNFNFTDLGEVVDDESFLGGKCWHVAATGEAKDGGINNQDNPITIEPGKTYTVSAYIKTKLLQGTAKFHLKVFKDEYADAVEYDSTAQVTGGSNQISNPDFETDITDWFGFGTGSALTRITTDYKFGNACGKMHTTAADQWVSISPVGFTRGSAHVFSAYVKGTADETIHLNIWDGEADHLGDAITLTGDWQRVSQVITPAATGIPELQIRRATGDTADDVLIDGVMVELGSTITEYSQWTRVSKTFTAGADYTILEVWIACGAWGTAFLGDIWVDAVLVEEADAITDYFDGDTADAYWEGTEGLSASILQILEYFGKTDEKKLWETIIGVTGESAQEIVAKYQSLTPATAKSLQAMLCNIAGIPETSKSVQQILFENLKTACSLTDPYTQYTVQDLLQLAITNEVTADGLLGL